MTTRTPSLPLPFGDRRAVPADGSAARPTWLVRTRRAVWRALCTVGERRSRQHLLGLAREVEASRPELAAQLRDTARRGWL